MKIDNLSLSDPIEAEIEFIPLMSEADEENLKKLEIPTEIPILPLRNTVLFPGVVVPVSAGRNRSIKLIEAAYKGNKILGAVAQKDGRVDEPEPEDLEEVGTVARIMRVLKLPDGNTTVILQGISRVRLDSVTQKKPFLKARVSALEEIAVPKKDKEYAVIIESIKDLAYKIIEEHPSIPSEASTAIRNIDNPSFLVNFVSSNLSLETKEKQMLLQHSELKQRAMDALKFMDVELQKLEIKNDIQSKVRTDLDQQQREYFLNQQIRTIQEELGGFSADQEVQDMREKAKGKKWDSETAENFERALLRLQRMNQQMPEYNIQRNYLEFMLELPWNEMSADNFDLRRAQNILDRDHFGLDKIKQRIVEHLAVLQLRKDMKSPILCLYGPPGVGKTSLGKSIAEALGREYVRMSLGGLHDESEIRGHRKTYIGAMPGRILQNLKKAKTSNPVFVLDEIDKMGAGNHGDPSSAMLEVLDPEQNSAFYDNFLEQGYDLSKVFFIATANQPHRIQSALRDRMEFVELSGYTIEEKIQIAKKYLLPKQIKEHGLKSGDIKIYKKAMEFVVENYTRESGVRQLDKSVAQLVRNAAMNVVLENDYEKVFTEEKIEEILGPPRPQAKYEGNSKLGVVTGLAWTRTGGTILFIESILSEGKGTLSITGNLGAVMKESTTIALEYIKAKARELKIDPKVFEKYRIHIHVPAGATPKDGPSAGIAMLTSMVSSFTKRKIKSRVAMTGEITLRGRVLPVGGIKEKILAAKRADIKEIILCKDNERDVLEIPQEYLKGLEFHYVTKMREVLDIALLPKKSDANDQKQNTK